jgi:PKD repeat protein
MKKLLLNQKNNSIKNKTAKPSGKFSLEWAALVLSCCLLFIGHANAQGTWTAVTKQAPDPNFGVMLLMTDGSVICHTSTGGTLGIGTIWDRLTPNAHGSYINGTWSKIAPMNRERYSFSSEILKDGRVYAAGGEYGTDGVQAGSHGEVYDNTNNTWTQAIGPNAIMSDGSCKLLDNGNVLQALVDVPFPVHTVVYNPTTNSYTTGPSTINGQNESMWLKLPDNSVLFVDEGLQSSERYIPSLNQWVADGTVPVALYDAFGFECGPAWMLPDGRAFFIGGTNHTAFYTPSGNNTPGTWVAGPDVPNGYGMPDAPGTMMANGKILFACSPQPTSSVEFATPTLFYEFDYLTNTFTEVNPPSTANVGAISQQYCLLGLPDGSVLCGLSQDNSSAQYYIYTPDGTPLASGKPAIDAVTKLNCTSFMITGHGFNGISEGSAFGDENEDDTNFPIIRLTSGGKVYYARSYNWNSTGVQRGNANDTTYFTVPESLPNGNYSLSVIANGIASDGLSFTDSIPSLSSSLAPPAICTGTAFTYSPTSNTNGVTITWTRAAQAGISNPAVSSPQVSDPNEVLIDTAGVPVTVIYSYVIHGFGCDNPENVSVVVNPVPTASFKAYPLTACQVPDTVTFLNNSIAADSYRWDFGDGKTSSARTPTHIYRAIGKYSVKLVATSTCGNDSVIQENFIDIDPPSVPITTSSSDTISCGGIATLHASGSDTLEWFNQANGGNPVGKGPDFITPSLLTNTTYYVESDVTGIPSFSPPPTDSFGTGTIFPNSNFQGDVFNVNEPCTLASVVVYSSVAGNRTIQLFDGSGNLLQNVVINIPVGQSTLTLNFPLSVGTGYTLGCGDDVTITNLFRNTTGAAFPYSDPGGFVTITGNTVPDNEHYYFFYNWQLHNPACIIGRAPVQVVVNGEPIAAFTPVINLNAVTFTNSSSGSNSWLWNFGDGDTSTLQSPVHTYASTGTFTATLTAFNNACFDTTSQTVSITILGVHSVDLTKNFSIFPNPTNGLITISLLSNSIGNGPLQLMITNTIGEVVYQTASATTGKQQFNLDLRNLSKGIYYVQLKTNNGFAVKKLVIN